MEDGLIPGRDYKSPKMLCKIYDIFPEYNKWNTVIIDDNPHTYRYNPMNTIPIRASNLFSKNWHFPMGGEQNVEKSEHSIFEHFC